MTRTSQTLKTLAKVFRRAIEVSELKYEGFRHFPRGSCGDASLLLSQFLQDHGFDQVEYVDGWAPEDGAPPHGSHGWLEVSGTIVDITGDQFETRPAPPVVVTTDRTWHSHFIEQKRCPARLDAAPFGTLVVLYPRVLDRIPVARGGRAE
jgi:hypothetical protein